MANANKKHFGVGAHGKSAGVGAMTELPKDKIGENDVMSNRDKKRHSDERGYDGKATQIDQLNDNALNQSDGKI
jgi:hypothetical protein